MSVSLNSMEQDSQRLTIQNTTLVTFINITHINRCHGACTATSPLNITDLCVTAWTALLEGSVPLLVTGFEVDGGFASCGANWQPLLLEMCEWNPH